MITISKEISNIRWKKFISSIFFFNVILFFQTNFISTGDGGELLTASWGLGSAHPPGYPFYLILGKIISLIPLGNIAFRIALLSSIFSLFNLILLEKILKLIDIKNSNIIFLFISLLLLQNYTFFYNSTIIKFYTLTSFWILLITYFTLKWIDKNESNYDYIVFFLLGIGTGVHNLTSLMLIPILILFLFNRYPIKKFIILIIIFCLSAIMINSYLFIISKKEVLLKITTANNFKELIGAVMRKGYKSDNFEIIKNALSISHKKFYFIKNVSVLFNKEFHFIFIIIFFIGVIYLFLKNKKKFLFLILIFITYSYFLGYLTFNSADLDTISWYVVANQYFLSGIIFFSIFCCIGVDGILSFIKKRNIKNFFILFFLILPIIFLPERFLDCNNFSNLVAKSKTKDSLFLLPLNSIIIMHGDNDVFQSWYFKNVLRFRDDLCIGAVTNINMKIISFKWGCREYNYPKKINIYKLAKLNNLYSNFPLDINKKFKKFLKSKIFGLNFINYPLKDNITKFQEIDLLNLKKILNVETCISNKADDFFTKNLCNKYSFFLVNEILNKSTYGRKLTIKIDFFNNTWKENIKINKQNLKTYILLKKILKKNEVYKIYLEE